MIKLFQGDCLNVMKALNSDSVDLVVTSPPYDKLRNYDNSNLEWNYEIFKKIANELKRVVKKGGIVVWVVGDATEKGSESGSSFRQALYFKEIGFNIHDTMIYQKDSFSFPMNNRYHQIFEYMFVFSNGSPKTFNPIKDRKNIYHGSTMSGTDRQRDGSLIKINFKNRKNSVIKEFGQRWNIWKYKVGYGKSSNKKIKKHPAVFPLELAIDHVISWSNEDDVILDPFMGSGTSGVACKKLNRNFIGIEINEDYFKISEKRINETKANNKR